jgi:hypothetical protein
MGQKFTPDEFGQDKIKNKLEDKILKLNLLCAGEVGRSPEVF